MGSTFQDLLERHEAERHHRIMAPSRHPAALPADGFVAIATAAEVLDITEDEVRAAAAHGLLEYRVDRGRMTSVRLAVVSVMAVTTR